MSFFREETEKQVETSCLEDAVRSHRRCDCVTVTMTVSFCFIASLCTIVSAFVTNLPSLNQLRVNQIL